MSDRHATLKYGDSRGSSNVTYVEYDFGEAVEAGDLLYIDSSDPSVVHKIGPDENKALYGVARDDVEAGEFGIVEVPSGAVYEVDLADSTNWDGDPSGSARVVHAYGQSLCRVTSGGPAAGNLVSDDAEMGGKGKVLLFGGGIDGIGSVIGTIPSNA